MATRVTVRIGTESRLLSDVREDWINRQIRIGSAGGPVCVRVIIEGPSVNMTLATPGCSVRGGSRPPSALENDVFALWEKRGLTEPDFQGGHVVAFLKQLRNLLGL